MNTLDSLDVAGKRVLVRVDFNVPLDGHTITDDTRITAALPTITALTGRGARVILASHLGRPKGDDRDAYSLRPVADHLGSLVGVPVAFSDQTVGAQAEQKAAELKDGEILVLENTRFLEGETKNADDVADGLARLADVYVNDAFGSAHRAHASTEGIARRVEHKAAGLLLAREIDYLGQLLGSPDAPFVAVLGGAKVSDKIGVIRALLPRVDQILIGGAMSYTFLRALGHQTGASKVEEDKLGLARSLYDEADGKLVLPRDHIAADAFSNDADTQIVQDEIPDGWMALDIGPNTISRYTNELRGAKTIVWNGPMGVFEMERFAKGTFAVAQAMADATRAGALTVVGGGDSVAAVVQSGKADEVSHVSTGGGAMLEFLEGTTLPGVAALG
jgi:phosphoglycerate kinase